MPPGKYRYSMSVRAAWQSNSVLSAVIRLKTVSLYNRSENLLFPALCSHKACLHRLPYTQEMLPPTHHALHFRTEEQQGQLETPWQCKITCVQPSGNTHSNDGAVLVRVRLGFDSATSSLKTRLWSLELGVTIDQ